MGGRKQAEAETALHDQTQLLPKKQLIFVFLIMDLALLVCFIDQNGIGVLLPSIARELNAQSSISWAGTSSLVRSRTSSIQPIFIADATLLDRQHCFPSPLRPTV